MHTLFQYYYTILLATIGGHNFVVKKFYIWTLGRKLWKDVFPVAIQLFPSWVVFLFNVVSCFIGFLGRFWPVIKKYKVMVNFLRIYGHTLYSFFTTTENLLFVGVHFGFVVVGKCASVPISFGV